MRFSGYREAVAIALEGMMRMDLPKDAELRIGRLQDTHVSERHKIVYIASSKVASTSLKLLMRDLETDAPLVFHPRNSGNCAQMDLLIHDKAQNALLPLSGYRGAALREILASPEWFRFAIIRHPYDRFFSAWRDKIFLCEPGLEEYLPGNGRKFMEFSDFARQIVANEDPMTCNVHWRAQTAVLLPDVIAYTRIYKIEELDLLLSDMERHLRVGGYASAMPPLRRVNESYPISMDGFMTAEIAASLRQFYRADFEYFGFEEREFPAAATRTAEELTNYFTDAIFDRNRVIAAHATYFQWGPRIFSDQLVTSFFRKLGFTPPERR